MLLLALGCLLLLVGGTEVGCEVGWDGMRDRDEDEMPIIDDVTRVGFHT